MKSFKYTTACNVLTIYTYQECIINKLNVYFTLPIHIHPFQVCLLTHEQSVQISYSTVNIAERRIDFLFIVQKV